MKKTGSRRKNNNSRYEGEGPAEEIIGVATGGE